MTEEELLAQMTPAVRASADSLSEAIKRRDPIASMFAGIASEAPEGMHNSIGATIGAINYLNDRVNLLEKQMAALQLLVGEKI